MKTPTNLDFVISGDRWRENLAEVKAAIVACEPVEALHLLDQLIAQLNPERDTAQAN